MHIYQLESKQMDEAFLQGHSVMCEATLSQEALAILKAGDKIVIQLSNRAKYMGVVKQLRFTISDPVAKGFLEIVRHH
jgi:hypothetical protein